MDDRQPLRILPGGSDIQAVHSLLIEYADWLGIDLGFQNFEAELESLPGKYGPPDGRLLLALWDGVPAGCIALRRHDPRRCEMKRLFVRQPFRGRTIGQRLVETLLAEATALGYHSMILDTMARMQGALTLYKRLGFTEIPAYYHNPEAGVVYLEKLLGPLPGPEACPR